MFYSGSRNKSKVSDPSGRKKVRKRTTFFKMQIYIAKRGGWLQMWYVNDPEELLKILF